MTGYSVNYGSIKVRHPAILCRSAQSSIPAHEIFKRFRVDFHRFVSGPRPGGPKRLAVFVYSTLGRRTRIAVVGALAAVALGVSGCTSETAAGGNSDVNSVDAGLAESIDAAMEQALALSGSTEAVVGIWSDSGEYVRGYGEGVTASTRFLAAQSAQPVTCAALLDAVSAGDIALDDPVTDVLTRQPNIEDLTFRQLCTHQSGLADFKAPIEGIYRSNPERLWEEQELLANSFAASPLSWPGLDTHVSDANSVLLSRALRTDAGTSSQELYTERVFGPLGMTSTEVQPYEATSVSGSALTPLVYPMSGGKHVCDAEDISVEGVSATMLAGAGNLSTTVSDMKRFYTAYLGDTFTNGDTAGITTETWLARNPEREEDGTAKEEMPEDGPRWGFSVEQFGPLYGRFGAITGTLSAAMSDPETGYTVVVALNNSSAGAGFVRDLAFELTAIASAAGAGPAEVPWTPESEAAKLQEAAVCQ